MGNKSLKNEWSKEECDAMSDSLFEKAGIRFVSDREAIAILQSQLTAANAKIEELREGLRKMEQALGGRLEWRENWWCCFGVCEYDTDANKYIGHKPDCWLNALLEEK